MLISVIICTHNPRADYLRRVLDALDRQGLSKDQWELLLIDNCSQDLVSAKWDLSWHPNSRHIREEQLGLTPARLRGIRESRGEMLVFVDDDNVLDRAYLEAVLRIARERPDLGALGGRILGDYEAPPPDWFQPHADLVAVRPLARDLWSNSYDWWPATPCGAGICVRRNIAFHYEAITAKCTDRLSLGRSGGKLSGSEDLDMAFTAIDLGYGVGRFTDLVLTHLIPKGRLELPYLERLAASTVESLVLLRSLRDATRDEPIKKQRLDQRLRRKVQLMRMEGHTARIVRAKDEGLERGRLLLLNKVTRP